MNESAHCRWLAVGRAVLLHKVVGDNIALKLYFNGRAGWLGLGIEHLIG